MDKIDSLNNLNHNVTINERKNIIISGVKKIESFDNEEFLLETTMGNIVIKGTINSLTYDSIKKEEGVFSKLFK